MDDPRPVQVVLPNGMEQVGIVIADDVIELGSIGSLLELRDAIVVDGVRREVVGVRTRADSACALVRPESEGAEIVARITHAPESPPRPLSRREQEGR